MPDRVHMVLSATLMETKITGAATRRMSRHSLFIGGSARLEGASRDRSPRGPNPLPHACRVSPGADGCKARGDSTCISPSGEALTQGAPPATRGVPRRESSRGSRAYSPASFAAVPMRSSESQYPRPRISSREPRTDVISRRCLARIRTAPLPTTLKPRLRATARPTRSSINSGSPRASARMMDRPSPAPSLWVCRDTSRAGAGAWRISRKSFSASSSLSASRLVFARSPRWTAGSIWTLPKGFFRRPRASILASATSGPVLLTIVMGGDPQGRRDRTAAPLRLLRVHN